MASVSSCRSSQAISDGARGGFTRPLVGIAAVALVLVGAGCGGDDEQGGDSATGPANAEKPRVTTQRPQSQPTQTAPAPADTGPRGSPEDQPGGAGDEEPARSQALLTGRAGAIRPRIVRVPPFIAIRVELRSADGRAYELRLRSRRLRAGGQLGSASTTFAGLRPGEALIGRGVGGVNDVRIEASAEPGP
jgi:hypothetical protein